MSRAFVKENEDQVPELPERPQSPHPNFVTPRGLALLKQQLVELEDAKTGDTVIWKRPAGDLELDVLSIHYPSE